MNVTAASDESDDFRRTLIALYPRLIQFARRLGERPADAEDLVHASIERALRKRRYFRGGVLESWMRAIIRNLLVDRRRHFQIAREIPWTNEQAFSDGCDDEEPVYRRSEAYNIEDLRRAVRRLPPALKVVYEMASFERASYREIGFRLSLNFDTVGTRLFRARQALRVILESGSAASGAQNGRKHTDTRLLWDEPSRASTVDAHADDRAPELDGPAMRGPVAGSGADPTLTDGC